MRNDTEVCDGWTCEKLGGVGGTLRERDSLLGVSWERLRGGSVLITSCNSDGDGSEVELPPLVVRALTKELSYGFIPEACKNAD